MLSDSTRSRAGFEDYVDRNTEHLMRTAYVMTSDLGEAEDLVQETLLRVARRWRRVHHMAHPEAYARRVLINLVFDGSAKRARRRTDVGGLEASDLHPEPRRGHEPNTEMHLDLIAGLRTLSARQRMMVVLRYFEDLSERQVAEVLNCSVGTVKSTTSRALAHLRTSLEGPSDRGIEVDDGVI
jgi:RNA polymerase sigma-70 factor (sigma-E family)